MGTKNQNLFNQVLTSLVAAASITAPVMATTKAPPTRKAPALGRGADVGELAGNCAIGKFAQTSKAGAYNALCDEMEDAEKCLGFLKQHFRSDGSTSRTYEGEKLEYCLTELEDVLGEKTTP